MKKLTKADKARLETLHRDAGRYDIHAHRAKAYFERTGEAMFVPGGLTESKRKSAAAKAEIAEIKAKYK